MKALIKLLTTYIILSLASTSGQADILDKKDLKDLATEAPQIVHGVCDSIETKWIGKTLVTEISLDVKEVLKGNDTQQIKIVIPGGVDMSRKFPVAVTYPDSTTFLANEEVVLFLKGSSIANNTYSLYGGSQGHISIAKGKTANTLQTARIQGPSARSAKGSLTNSKGDKLVAAIKQLIANDMPIQIPLTNQE